MPKASVQLQDNYKTVIHLRDHTIIADEPASEGGTDAGPTPVELLLASLGACAAITAKLYANRKGWPLEGVTVNLSNERFKAGDYPAYSGEADFVNEFRQHIEFHGPLSHEQRERLLEIAGKCPVHRILTSPNFVIDELVDTDLPEREQPPAH
jgi:uncharacterized OsmC-like protein